MSMFDTFLSGPERRAEAIAEHTALMFDRVFNPPKMSAATEPRPRVGIAQEGSSSPRADARTASVSVSHERFVSKVRDLLLAERYDDALSVVEDEHSAYHGPRG